MIAELVYAGILLASYGYHRWQEYQAKKDSELDEVEKPFNEVSIPRVDEGAPIPLVYGRCRVRSPILAWVSTPYQGGITPPGSGDLYFSVPTNSIGYAASMFLLAGIPFQNGTNRIYRAWVSERALQEFPASHFGVGAAQVTLPELTGEGNFEGGPVGGSFTPGDRECWIGTPLFFDNGLNTKRTDETNMWIEGRLEFLNGNDDQQLTDGVGNALTVAAQVMMADGIAASDIPNYRRRLGIFLYGMPDGLGEAVPEKWHIGLSPSLPALQFEMSSYPEGFGLAGTRTIGQEANPADVIYDLLTSPLKLNLPAASVDIASFTTAAITLLNEADGYSRSIEEIRSADEHIYEILKQIDAVLYVDPRTLRWTIKLIRADYDPAAAPHFTPSNCTLERWALSGHTGVVNKIRVPFSNRQEHYREGNGEASNDANAVGQSGEVNELVVPMYGICTQASADSHAERELSARSRPVAIARIVAGPRHAYLTPGTAAALSWPELGVSGMMFRIAKINRGTIGNESVTIDLIQDFAQLNRGAFDLVEYPGVPAHR